MTADAQTRDLTAPPTREAFDILVQSMRPDDYAENPNHPQAHARLDVLVDRFAASLRSKLHRSQEKYGWPIERSWMGPLWGEKDCLHEFARHVDKGDPLDVAAYCAFMWFHGWNTNGALNEAIAHRAKEMVRHWWERAMKPLTSDDEDAQAIALAMSIVDDTSEDPDSGRALLARALLRRHAQPKPPATVDTINGGLGVTVVLKCSDYDSEAHRVEEPLPGLVVTLDVDGSVLHIDIEDLEANMVPVDAQPTSSPRDGGVREALEERIAEALWIAHDPAGDPPWVDWVAYAKKHPHHQVSVDKYRLLASAALAALSAPGSAGPGEPTDEMLEAFYRAAWPAAWDLNGHITDCKIANLRKGWQAAMALVTPSPAGQPDTGETEGGWRPIATAPKNGTDILLFAEAWSMSWGVQIGRHEGGAWHTAEGSAPENDTDFDPEAEIDDEDDFDEDRNIGPTHWMPLPPTPATTAETRGPAEDAR